MMRALKIAGLVLFVLTPALGTVGCSAYDAAHNHNAPTPARDLHLTWTRIDTPGNFPSAIMACYKGDGYYATMDTSSSIEVEPNDPACRGAVGK